MLAPMTISPHADFWAIVARQMQAEQGSLLDYQVLVPAFSHAQCLKQALAAQSHGALLAPRIHTLDAWLALQAQLELPAASHRLLALYAELRQHGWLKNLFAAREQLDLLPLANTLLDLCDELSGALLPAMLAGGGSSGSEARWQQALQQLAPPARQLLSEESQLVWSIWKAQVDQDDPALLRMQAMLRLARQARRPLLWINPVAPDALQQPFLQAYAQQQPVRVITLDWRAGALQPLFRRAWPELLHDEAADEHRLFDEDDVLAAPPLLSLCPAAGLEQEAQQGAQCVLNWLQQGKTRIAIIAQDRVVARRIRALLERSQVWVADETGWKLSTTRAAAVLAAWFEVLASSGEVIALLDLLKSPFVFPAMEGRDDWLITLEAALRRQNVLSGWQALLAALPARLDAAPLRKLAQQAAQYTGRKTVAEWAALLDRTLELLGIKNALANDLAGQQVLALLANIAAGSQGLASHFQLAEWRAVISLQIEATPFVPENVDQRVLMLPLNGARLRPFEAVLMVGVDAAGLPSQPPEVLFFANAVRRELGLATREQRQQQQMRDLTEILTSGAEVVLSWQQFKNGEPNACSPWLERLQLVLALSAAQSGAQFYDRPHDHPHGQRDSESRRQHGVESQAQFDGESHAQHGGHSQGASALPLLHLPLPRQTLHPTPTAFARPAAAALLPDKLSSSGYQRFLACPYAFFASYMLGLSGWDEFSDLPEKRDYGDWLHGILHDFHQKLLEDGTLDQPALLAQISSQKFEQELRKSAAALGYFVRWQKTMPAYLAWHAAHAAAGWQYVAGEQKLERPLHWPGGQITLRGRIDRIDRDVDGQTLVLDYKTSSQAVLKQKMQGEDQQLAFYGLLAEQAGQAMLLGLQAANQKIAEVPAPDYANWVRQLEAHIARSMQSLQQGSPLPANGIDSACQYCEMRGLCRKGAWQ